MNHLQRKQLQRNQLKRNNFQWTNFCKIRNNFIWNSLGCKFGHFKIFYELIFELWELFSVIFLDSDVTGRFQCELTKTGYVAHFGFSPHFHELMSKLSDCPYISLSFDESSNSSVQKGQMSIIIRFQDSETNCVATRYPGSEFMGTSTAKNVLQKFLASISDLDQSKILQNSSDDPNANLFLKNVAEPQDEKELLPLLDIVRYRLHAIHNSFKSGTKKEVIENFKNC